MARAIAASADDTGHSDKALLFFMLRLLFFAVNIVLWLCRVVLNFCHPRLERGSCFVIKIPGQAGNDTQNGGLTTAKKSPEKYTFSGQAPQGRQVDVLRTSGGIITETYFTAKTLNQTEWL